MMECGAMVRGQDWVHSALVMVMFFVDHGEMISCMERQVVLLKLVAIYVFVEMNFGPALTCTITSSAANSSIDCARTALSTFNLFLFL